MATTTHNNHFSWHLFSRHHAEPTEKHWGWLLVLGVLFVTLGTIGLIMTVLMTLASIIAIGILALAGGLVQVVHSLSFPNWMGKVSHLLIGLLYVAAGLVIISDPLAASAIFTLILASILIAIGILRIGFSYLNRLHHRWVWPLIGGIISIVLGVMIVLQWPVTGLWVIGMFVAIEMIFHGWGYVGLALTGKRT